jgi:hypothetical protein
VVGGHTCLGIFSKCWRLVAQGQESYRNPNINTPCMGTVQSFILKQVVHTITTVL